ncbi:MAG: hypothetical protein HN509_01790 [Halobacteriovoraceae bacterium]|nr:hypothetical protein [Halobacteriovoraceae bacterium]MBT5095003.1 hypothetical protein [Halobacteriovoraceae bacterium]
MKYLLVIASLFIFATQANARSITATAGVSTAPTEYGNVILGSIWEDAGWPKAVPHNIAPTPQPAPIVPVKKVTKKEVKKTPPKVIPPKIKKVVKEDTIDEDDDGDMIDDEDGDEKPVKKKVAKKSKKLTKGQQHIKDMLNKNRQRLKDKTRQQKDQAQQEKVDKLDNSSKSLREQYLNNLAKLKNRNKKTFSDWRKQRAATYKRWKEKQKIFYKNIKYYKKAQFNFEAPVVSIPKRELKKPVSTAPRDKYHVIPGALDAPVRDQGRRPTCAAFAGIRAIELLLRSSDVKQDLSEQYFYWASKPNCQNRPCTQRGSWVLKGFGSSKSSFSPNIPGENACPYKKQQVNGNETQTPLTNRCKSGSVKVSGYKRLSSLDDIMGALKSNQPVVAGFKLSPNFYKNNGLISYGASFVNGKMDSHAMGHAVLLIGYMQLPEKLHGREGRVCLLVANSWGEGWGRGGHACVTERWVRQYRIENAFVALNKADIL